MAKSKVVITEEMVDELVTIREKLRALTAREKELKDIFRDGGAATYSSKNCAIEISFTSKMIMDSEKVRAFIGAANMPAYMKASEQMNIKTMELA
jgi:hypothetical protein